MTTNNHREGVKFEKSRVMGYVFWEELGCGARE